MARAGSALHDAVAVVTGATRGIGRSVVEQFLARGARVGCVARDAGELDALRLELGTARVAVRAADVSDRGEIEAALAALAQDLGPVDILVNNAGVGLFGPVLDAAVEDVERLMAVNFLGVVYATRAVLPSMVERGRGHIVTVGSIAGLVATPLEAAYSASKFAATGFCEALAVEVAPFGVEVTMVHPGPVATTFFERRGHPYTRSRPAPIPAGDVARAVVAAVEQGRVQQVLPRWLASAPIVRALLPALYRRGVAASFKGELGP
ncbi:MAG: SDR family NAD(P)-dependent oxidoreductase [Acidimicrobiales bacterium]